MPSRKIKLWSTTALVTGNMIGSGIFLLPASLAAYGSVSLLSWLISSFGAIVLALIFGNLAKNIPATGGPYVYARVGYGRFAAFTVAWGYWISIWCTNAAITVALVGYLGVFFPLLNTHVAAAVFTGLTAVWIITWINTRQIAFVGRVQLVTTILKITPLALIGLLGIFFIDTGNFPAFNTSGETDFSAIATTTMLTFFAFQGMESATIPASGIDSPATTIRRATLMGTLLTVLIYLLCTIALMGLLSPSVLSVSTAPFSDAASLFWGPAARYIVAGGAVVSTLGALNGWILLQGQIPMAAAQDKLFPKRFGKTNKHAAPATGIVISSILVSLLLTINYFKGLVEAFSFIVNLATLSIILPYLFSVATFSKMRRGTGEKYTRAGQILPFLAFLFLALVTIGCGWEIVFYGILLLLAGIPFYFGIQKQS